MKYPTWVVLLALLVEVVLSGNVRAQPEEMTFLTQPPIPPAEIFGNAWTIFAEGPIDPGASARFKRIIADNKIPPLSLVHFNSPGGNLLAGMELGRLIRKNGYFTVRIRRGPRNQGLKRQSGSNEGFRRPGSAGAAASSSRAAAGRCAWPGDPAGVPARRSARLAGRRR